MDLNRFILCLNLVCGLCVPESQKNQRSPEQGIVMVSVPVKMPVVINLLERIRNMRAVIIKPVISRLIVADKVKIVRDGVVPVVKYFLYDGITTKRDRSKEGVFVRISACKTIAQKTGSPVWGRFEAILGPLSENIPVFTNPRQANQSSAHSLTAFILTLGG